MSHEPPIACSLSAAQYPGRLAELRAIGAAGLLGGEGTAAAPVLRFRADGDIRERLAAVVAAESRCCAFLELALAREADTLTLTITGPNAAAPVVGDLVDAFSARP